MKRCLAVACLSLLVFSHPAAAATPVAINADDLDAGIIGEARLGGSPAPSLSEPVTSVRVAAPPSAPGQPLSANPLWAIALSRLSGTRDRPIFSPSRRPPPPVVASESPAVRLPPPPPTKDLEPPPLALVGTIASDEQGFGIFVDQSTKQSLRLKVGEDYQGWRLRAIRGREVVLEKDHQGFAMDLPPPGGQSSGEVRLLPVSAEGVTSTAATRP